MTLPHIVRIKLRLLSRRRQAPLELRVWDAVVTLWLMGLMGLPAATLLHETWAIVGCVAGLLLPMLYLRLRLLLHRRGWLRCDWRHEPSGSPVTAPADG